jgi:hypothetical protein
MRYKLIFTDKSFSQDQKNQGWLTGLVSRP